MLFMIYGNKLFVPSAEALSPKVVQALVTFQSVSPAASKAACQLSALIDYLKYLKSNMASAISATLYPTPVTII